jgi:hypothetical protein
LPKLKPGAPPYKGLPATANRRSVKRAEKMEGGADSGRGNTVEGFKAELYESIELLLADRELRKLLCSLDNGVYRDFLVAYLKRLLRPITTNDVIDMISNLMQFGLFEVELRTLPPIPLPKQLFVKKKETKEGVIEILKPPRGFEVIGVYGDKILVKTFKVFLKPSKELKSVCSILKG